MSLVALFNLIVFLLFTSIICKVLYISVTKTLLAYINFVCKVSMPKIKCPKVHKCCGIVTDLKSAATIIAVLGIVTSPAMTWAVVRHSYVTRVSCHVTTSAKRTDVIDINLNNVVSFGFGTNAGLGPSCIQNSNKSRTRSDDYPIFRAVDPEDSPFVLGVRWFGWAVLFADLIFIGFSIHLLYKIFKPPENKAAIRFMISCIVAIIFSFIYGMLYVVACIVLGGSFPAFEFLFSVIDVLIWTYFIIVLNSYRLRSDSATV